MSILVDSNIMIDFLKGNKNIFDKINEIISEGLPIFISTISIYEVYMGIIVNLYLKRGNSLKVPDLIKYITNFFQIVTF